MAGEFGGLEVPLERRISFHAMCALGALPNPIELGAPLQTSWAAERLDVRFDQQ